MGTNRLKIPSEKSLHVMLDLLWNDLFHVRGQTWRMLEIEAILVLIFIFTDYSLGNQISTTLFGCIAVIGSASGLKATIHHRKTQIRILTNINNVENELGLIRSGLIDNLSIPTEILLFDAFNIRNNSTPIFIIRMHFALLFLSIGYMITQLTVR